MMKVLHIDHSTEVSGAELALLRMIRHASEDRLWEPRVAVPASPTGHGVFSVLKQGVVIPAPPEQHPGAAAGGALSALMHGLRVLAFGVAIARSTSVAGTDVVHANSTRASIAGLVASRLLRRPLVIHVRDMVDQESLGRIGSWVMKRLVLPRAAAVVAPSRAALSTAEPFAASRAIRAVIPSAIGVGVRATPFERRSAVRVVGMVARLAPWKGQAFLIDAFATLATSYPDVNLRLIGGAGFGGGEYQDELERKVLSLGLSDRVEFVGQVAPESVSDYIDNLDICVHSSIIPEPLGQNVLQYLARGSVVLASGEGGPCEWIKDGENGILFEPRSRDELAASLRSLIENSDLRERLRAGAARTGRVLNDAGNTLLMRNLFADAMKDLEAKK